MVPGTLARVAALFTNKMLCQRLSAVLEGAGLQFGEREACRPDWRLRARPGGGQQDGLPTLSAGQEPLSS